MDLGVGWVLKQTLLFGGAKNAKKGDVLPAQRVFKVSCRRIFIRAVITILVLYTKFSISVEIQFEKG